MYGRVPIVGRRKEHQEALPGTLLHVSIALALFLTAIAGMDAIREFLFPRVPWLDNLTEIGDVALIQLLSAAICAILLAAWLFPRLKRRAVGNRQIGEILSDRPHARPAVVTLMVVASLILAGLTITFLLAVEYGLEVNVFKPNFDTPRPLNPLPPSWALAWAEKLAGIDRDSPAHMLSEGAPSGWVLRQWWLLLFQLIIARSLRARADIASRARRLLYALDAFAIAAVVFVAFARVYRRDHYLFDVLLGVGVGNWSFWLGAWGLSRFPRFVPRESERYTTSIVVSLLPQVCFFFLYSASSYRWVLVTVVLLPIIAILNWKYRPRLSYRGYLEDELKRRRRR